jgi:hypothetical protein
MLGRLEVWAVPKQKQQCSEDADAHHQLIRPLVAAIRPHHRPDLGTHGADVEENRPVRSGTLESVTQRRSPQVSESLMQRRPHAPCATTLAEMFAAATTNKPGREITNRVMTGTLVARSVLNVAELALQGLPGAAGSIAPRGTNACSVMRRRRASTRSRKAPSATTLAAWRSGSRFAPDHDAGLPAQLDSGSIRTSVSSRLT